MAVLGYARVSTTGQTLVAQLEQLEAAGCQRIYRETASGAREDRRELKRALNALKTADVLIVTRLDRLARSTLDLLTSLAAVSAKGAKFRSLAEPWADTNTPAGRLMLTILGGLAEFERHLITNRTAEGRERARRAGVRFGPKPKLTAEQQQQIREKRLAGASTRKLGKEFGVSATTISRVR
jgi:DNA invertase Pin-like site-specific DNA recombinase